MFAVIGPVDVYLRGNFKPDIAGQVIQFRNRRFEDEDIAGQVIGDMENPQIGDVNLISFDPHPNLTPHPYIEWFSTKKNHYRIELEPADAWIIPASEMGEIDRVSRTIREALAGRMTERPTQEPTGWVQRTRKLLFLVKRTFVGGRSRGLWRIAWTKRQFCIRFACMLSARSDTSPVERRECSNLMTAERYGLKNDRRNFGMVGMICRLHPCQTSRALLYPDIARRQSKGIDQQRIRVFPS